MNRDTLYSGHLVDISAGATLALPDSTRMFGKEFDTEPTRHLIGTAQAWGGLPESEAYYYVETEPRQVDDYTLTLTDPSPSRRFWDSSRTQHRRIRPERAENSPGIVGCPLLEPAVGSMRVVMLDVLVEQPSELARFCITQTPG